MIDIEGVLKSIQEIDDTVVDLEKKLATANERIGELEAEMTWIPVSERSPEAIKHVLICAKNTSGDIWAASCSYLPAYGGFAHYHGQVTHWMPLPKLPKMKKRKALEKQDE